MLAWGWLAAALVLPAAAQGTIPSSRQADEQTTETIPSRKIANIKKVAGIHYFRLPGVKGVIIPNWSGTRADYVVLMPEDASAQTPEELKALGERFHKAYEMSSSYRVTVASDNSAVFLSRGGAQTQSARSVLPGSSLLPVITWLNAVAGGSPSGFKGTSLLWKADDATRKAHFSRRTLEISLDLLYGAPCCVDVKVKSLPPKSAGKVLGQTMKLSFRTVDTSEISPLRRELGERPLCSSSVGSSHSSRDGRDRDAFLSSSTSSQTDVYLVQVASSSSLFRMGIKKALVQRKNAKARKEEEKFPQVDVSPWPTPAMKEQAEEKPAATEEPTPVAEPAAEPASDTLAPEEAREEYVKKLRAL